MLSLILLVFAFVLLAVAAFLSPPEHPWKGRLALFGFACWVLAEILVRTPGIPGITR